MRRWCIIAAFLLAYAAAEPHHDGTNHHHKEQEAAEDDPKELIMLEIEPLTNNSTKGKRSPQGSQALYGTSPGQFVVRTASPQAAAPEIPPEYLNVLQQLVAQQHPQEPADTQHLPAPVIQQLLVSRNPDPTAVQFSSAPGTQQVPRRRPQDEPGAQLQQIYFDRQFQQQIPVRPRYLRPPPQRTASQATSGLPASVTASPQAHSIHDARLRASLAGENPNLLQQQLTFAVPTQAPEAAAAAAYQHQQQQQLLVQPQQQVSYVQQAPAVTQRAVAAQPPPQQQQQVIRRPAPPPAPVPEQYLRETTAQQASDASLFLPQPQSDEDLLSQILASKNGRGLFPGPSTPAPAVSTTTTLPATPSRSSIYVSQTTNSHRGPSAGVSVQEEVTQVGSEGSLPIVRLPTPKGQRPLTQSEFQALLDAGFSLTPVEDPSQQQQVPTYYTQTTTPKRQRSYATPAPPTRNQVQETRKVPLEEPRQQPVRYTIPDVESRPQEIRYTNSEPIQRQPQRQEVRYTNPEEIQRQPQQQVRYTSSETIQPQPEQQVRYTSSEAIQPQPEQQQLRYTNPEEIQPRPQQQEEQEEVRIQFPRPGSRGGQYSSFRYEAAAPKKPEEEVQYVQIPARRPLTRYPSEEAEQQVQAYQDEQQLQAYQPQEERGSVQNFQPIVVADLPSTTPQAPVPRRRRPRPSQNRAVYRPQTDLEDQRQEQPSGQFLISYEPVPDTTTYGSRRSRQRSRRPSPPPES